MKKKEIIILAAVMAAALLAMAVLYFFYNKQGAYVEVLLDNEVIAFYPLKEDGVYELSGYKGGRNILYIKDKEAYVAEASCPDKLCIQQKKISHTGEMIVCLPNHILVKVVEGSQNDLDGIAN